MSSEEFLSDSETQATFIEAVAQSAGVSNTSIAITGVNETSVTDRRVIRRRLASTTVLTIDYIIQAVIQELGFQDTAGAVGSLKDSINAKVASGKFLSILRNVSSSKNKTSVFKNVVVKEVVVKDVAEHYNSKSPTLAPIDEPKSLSKNDNKQFSESWLFVLIIAAAGVVFLGLIGGLVWIFSRKSPNGSRRTVSPPGQQSIVPHTMDLAAVKRDEEQGIILGGGDNAKGYSAIAIKEFGDAGVAL